MGRAAADLPRRRNCDTARRRLRSAGRMARMSGGIVEGLRPGCLRGGAVPRRRLRATARAAARDGGGTAARGRRKRSASRAAGASGGAVRAPVRRRSRRPCCGRRRRRDGRGRNRYWSASAATSGPMRSKGASARRDSRPGRRTGTAVQPAELQGCRRRRRRGESRRAAVRAMPRVGKPGDAGAACLRRRSARSLRFSGREGFECRPGGRRVGPIAAAFFAPSRSFSKWPAWSPRVLQRGAARLARDLLVVGAIGQQAGERLAPGSDVLSRDFRHRNHLLIEAGFVLFDGAHRQADRGRPSGLGDAADVGRHHRHAAQQRLQNDARARLGPQGRHQQHARAGEQQIDVVHGREQAYVGPGFERGAILLVGAPGGHGGELRLRETRRPAPGRSRCLSRRRD